METDREVLRKAERGLRQAVYELTWAGALWGPCGAIHVSRQRAKFLRALGEEASALSALSSTYYTACGNAAARGQQTSGLAKVFWFFRAVWCLGRAVVLSNRLERRVGLSGMSADQLDVRQSILRKARRYEGALRCLREALKRDNLSPDTRALLLVGMGEAQWASGEYRRAATTYDEARALLGQVKATSQVRVLRAIAEYNFRAADRAGFPQDLSVARPMAIRDLNDAHRIALEQGLHDQVVKIQALLKRVGHRGG